MENVVDVRITWECLLSKVKLKAKWCNYLTALEKITTCL